MPESLMLLRRFLVVVVVVVVCSVLARYMAPEMINGGGYGCSVDWWALGTLVYEMLTGDPPFHCKNTDRLYKLIRTKKISLPGSVWLRCVCRASAVHVALFATFVLMLSVVELWCAIFGPFATDT